MTRIAAALSLLLCAYGCKTTAPRTPSTWRMTYTENAGVGRADLSYGSGPDAALAPLEACAKAETGVTCSNDDGWTMFLDASRTSSQLNGPAIVTTVALACTATAGGSDCRQVVGP